MNQRTVFSLFFILFSNLFLVSLVSAGECFELKYDDGTWEDSVVDDSDLFSAVRFSLPWAGMGRLVMARYYIRFDPDIFVLHVFDLEGNDLLEPFAVTPTSTGWFEVPLDLVVSGDFLIALEWLDSTGPFLGVDNTSPQGRSYRGAVRPDFYMLSYGANYMIRAEVCEIPPVGGEILPNRFSTITSWLITGISTIVVTIGIALKKKKLH